jgi:hypothetical protein
VEAIVSDGKSMQENAKTGRGDDEIETLEIEAEAMARLLGGRGKIWRREEERK